MMSRIGIFVPMLHVPERMRTQPKRPAANLWNQDLGYQAYWHNAFTMTNRGEDHHPAATDDIGAGLDRLSDKQATTACQQDIEECQDG
eukprot:6066710-Pyramimonas_sp.AAC.1